MAESLEELTAWVEEVKARAARFGSGIEVILMPTYRYRELGRPKSIAGIKVKSSVLRNRDGDIALAMEEFILSCNCGECDFCLKRGRYA